MIGRLNLGGFQYEVPEMTVELLKEVNTVASLVNIMLEAASNTLDYCIEEMHLSIILDYCIVGMHLEMLG